MTAIHCAATGCQSTSLTVPGVESVGASSMLSPTQGFAIGNHMAYGPLVGDHERIGVLESTLLFYDGGQWSVIPSAG